jgi:hypothetical protein
MEGWMDGVGGEQLQKREIIPYKKRWDGVFEERVRGDLPEAGLRPGAGYGNFAPEDGLARADGKAAGCAGYQLIEVEHPGRDQEKVTQ